MSFNVIDHLILNWNLIGPWTGLIFYCIYFVVLLFITRRQNYSGGWILVLIMLQVPSLISSMLEMRLKTTLCQNYLNLDKDQCFLSRKGSSSERESNDNIRYIVIKRESLNKNLDTYSVYKKDELSTRGNLKEYYFIQLYPQAYDWSSFISLFENELPRKLERQSASIKLQVDQFLAYQDTTVNKIDQITDNKDSKVSK